MYFDAVKSDSSLALCKFVVRSALFSFNIYFNTQSECIFQWGGSGFKVILSPHLGRLKNKIRTRNVSRPKHWYKHFVKSWLFLIVLYLETFPSLKSRFNPFRVGKHFFIPSKSRCLYFTQKVQLPYYNEVYPHLPPYEKVIFFPFIKIS